MRRLVIASLLLAALPASAADPLGDYLRSNGRPPAEYILSKLADHRVVIVGENHWFRRDTELVVSLVPELRRRGAATSRDSRTRTQASILPAFGITGIRDRSRIGWVPDTTYFGDCGYRRSVAESLW